MNNKLAAIFAITLLVASLVMTEGRARSIHADECYIRLAQAVPSNPGVSPGGGVSGGPQSGRGISNPGVPPSGSRDQLRLQENISQQQLLRENAMARKEAAQMQRQSEIEYRYYLKRDPIEAREAAREAKLWKERKDLLDKQRERLLQSENKN